MNLHYRPPVTVREMVSMAARVFDTTERDIMSKSRLRPHARPRQAIYWLAAKQGWSRSAVGRALNRDHSTVGYGCEMVPVFRRFDPEFDERVGQLEQAVAERCAA